MSIELLNIEFYSADDVFVKVMHLPEAGLLVPQHSHEYSHLSMLAVGSVRVWRDDVLLGDFHSPAGIEIEAKCKHRFLSLEPSIIYCIHNVSRTGKYEFLEEHQLGG